MVSDAPRPWHKTLLVQHIITMMLQIEKLGMSISATGAFESRIAADCRHLLGSLQMDVEKSPLDAACDRFVMVPRGTVMSELWDALRTVREEWLAQRMVEAGYKRKWFDVIGTDEQRRASEHYAKLDDQAPTIEAAIREHRETVRLSGALAA